MTQTEIERLATANAIKRLEAWNEGDTEAFANAKPYDADGPRYQQDIRDLIAAVKRRGDILRAILEADECGQGQPFAEAMEAAAEEIIGPGKFARERRGRLLIAMAKRWLSKPITSRV